VRPPGGAASVFAQGAKLCLRPKLQNGVSPAPDLLKNSAQGLEARMHPMRLRPATEESKVANRQAAVVAESVEAELPEGRPIYR
jgi:hypothetical protein